MSTKEQITYEQLLEKNACEEALAFFLNMLNGTSYTEDHLPTDEQLKTLITRTPEFEYSRSFVEFALQTEISEWVSWFWYEGLLPVISLGGVDLSGAYLWGADLREAHLQGANLQEVNLRLADLEGAYLREANLQKANLRGADLRGANLRGASLYGADLKSTNLEGADLKEANLSGANLEEADLRGADLYKTNLEGIYWDNKTIWPKGFVPPQSA